MERTLLRAHRRCAMATLNLRPPFLPWLAAMVRAALILSREGASNMDTLVPHGATELGEMPKVVVSGNGHPGSLATLEQSKAHDLVTVFKLLADETRLKILHYLTQKTELNVCTFVGLLHQTQPAVSHHLALLREAGLIECRRDGKHNFYHLVPQRCQMFLDTAFGMAGQ